MIKVKNNKGRGSAICQPKILIHTNITHTGTLSNPWFAQFRKETKTNKKKNNLAKEQNSDLHNNFSTNQWNTQHLIGFALPGKKPAHTLILTHRMNKTK